MKWKPQYWIIVHVILAIVLFRNTLTQAVDFEALWRAAHYSLTGEAVYSFERDYIMCAKYPPWIIPLYYPFALFSLATAKGLWGLTLSLSYLFVIYWMSRQKLNPAVVALGSVGFIGIWGIQALSGQAFLPLLALALYLFSQKDSEVKFQGLAYFLSFKLATWFPLLFYWKSFLKLKRLVMVALLLTLFSLPVFLFDQNQSALEIIQSWRTAVSPSFHEGVAMVTIKGRQAQAFSSLIYRIFDLDIKNFMLTFILTLSTAAVLAGYWFLISKKLSQQKQWVGWLGLMVCVQPLTGFYTFVMAFPLCIYAIESSIESRSKMKIFLSVLALLMTAALTNKTLGQFGILLEEMSIKSWGVLLASYVLSRSAQTSKAA